MSHPAFATQMNHYPIDTTTDGSGNMFIPSVADAKCVMRVSKVHVRQLHQQRSYHLQKCNRSICFSSQMLEEFVIWLIKSILSINSAAQGKFLHYSNKSNLIPGTISSEDWLDTSLWCDTDLKADGLVLVCPGCGYRASTNAVKSNISIAFSVLFVSACRLNRSCGTYKLITGYQAWPL